jgi:hypothetical protein
MLTLLRNISQTSIPDPFAFLDYSVSFLLWGTLVLPFNKTACYHFDPVASWSFEPASTYLDTVVSSIIQPETTWTIGVISIPDLITHDFTIQRGHPLDTIERRRAVVEQFTDRQWKNFSFGPPEYHVYQDPPPPPLQPPTISDVIVAPLFTSIIVGYVVADDVEIQIVYTEVLDSNTYELVELQQAEVPDGAVSYEAVFHFLDIALG